MVDAYQDHLDFEAGRFGSELEAAYAVSRATVAIPDDSFLIREALEAGRVVLVCEYPVYCRHTDAYLGWARELEAAYVADAVPADLELFVDDDGAGRFLRYPSELVPVPLVAPASDEDIPF